MCFVKGLNHIDAETQACEIKYSVNVPVEVNFTLTGFYFIMIECYN